MIYIQFNFNIFYELSFVLSLIDIYFDLLLPFLQIVINY